ncbi:MAG: hypothetical protein HRU03_03070 [Nanoarchaeales archaeon]|nr:hypothetical protein [Nanoarchaeales archaeon]
MVNTNKKLIDELKKYNSELDKHVSGIDLGLMAKSLKNNSPSDDAIEFNHLFSQNLLDLRLEVSLLRKNLSVDIEGMVMKVVNEQQNLFSNKMNNLFLQTTLDMKTFLNDMVLKFGNEITQIKKSYNEMSVQNSNMISQISSLSSEILVLRDEFQRQNYGQTQIDITRKLDEIENTIQLSTTLINEHNQMLDGQFSHVNKTLTKISNNANQVQLPLVEKMQHVKTSKKVVIKHDPFNTLSSQNTDEPLIEVVHTDFDLEIEPSSQIPNKILDIDSRLSKLKNLK